MDKHVLITYASKYGATREIAQKIGEVLHQSGLQADVLPVAGVRDITPYKAVVMGGALYIDKWHKGAVEFLKANEKALSARPVWIFSSGPTGEGDPVELVKGQRLPASVQPVADRIHPRDITVFHGNIDPDKVNFMEKMAIKNIVKKPFGDFRDWDSIVRWSTSIAAELKEGNNER